MSKFERLQEAMYERELSKGDKSRVVYVLLGFFTGLLGLHNCYAGYFGRAICQVVITLLLGWLIFPLIAVAFWELVEICTVTKDAKGLKFT